jgi:hypothetical protein
MIGLSVVTAVLFRIDELQPAMDAINETVAEIADELYDAGRIEDRFSDEGFYMRLTKLERACPGTSVKMHV